MAKSLDTQLAELSFSGSMTDQVSPLSPDANLGYAATTLPSLARFAEGEIATRAIQSEVLHALSLAVERAACPGPGVLLFIRSADDKDIGSRALLHAETTVENSVSTENFVRIEAAGAALVSHSTRGRVLISVNAEGVISLAGDPVMPFVVPALERLEVNVTSFVSAAAPDWLRSLAEAAHASQHAYRIASAAGVLQRLDTPSDAAAQLQALLSGEGVSSGPSVWASSLTSAERATIVDLSRAAARSLLDTFDWMEACSLESTLDPTVLKAAMYDRDDLAGVQVMLAVQTGECGLNSVLELVDRAGLRLVRIVGRRGETQDLRLKRVAEVEPESWWGSVVVSS